VRTTVVRVERQRRWLEEVRELLSVEERALLTLRVDRELSWAEIAEVLAAEGKRVEAATVAKRYERLKERLIAVVRNRDPGD
jgi:RNA polymerase sigma-70 factor, ECF subfamily